MPLRVKGDTSTCRDHMKRRSQIKIEVGTYVRISSEYPANRNLQSQTGYIEDLPNIEHPGEYLIKLDGGITLSPHLTGRLIRVSANYLEPADQIRNI